MKNNLILHMLPETIGENCVELSTKFLKETMKIIEEIKIEVAHRIGVGQNRHIVLHLADAFQKRLIFGNVKIIHCDLFCLELAWSDTPV